MSATPRHRVLFFELFPALLMIASAIIVVRLVIVDRAAARRDADADAERHD